MHRLMEESELMLKEECSQNKENNCHFQRVSNHKSLKMLSKKGKNKKPLKIKTKEENRMFNVKLPGQNEIVIFL